MLTIKQLRELEQPGDWFTTIDLKDAYFHVKIAPKHRRYLRFAFQGIAYEYNRLPFGYSLSPRMFSVHHFKPLPQGKHVLVRSDNLTTVAYINRQDGVSSAALLSAAENLWLWASENVIISKGPPYSGRTGGPASC